MQELIIIKLGGSVITDKSREYTPREDNIKRFAEEIRESEKVFKGKFIIGHGAGSFAHTPAAKFQTKKGLINSRSLMGAAITEEAARALNAILIRNFVSKKLPVFPFSPASFLISDIQVYKKSYLDTIKTALSTGFLPVVYGDVVMDKITGFTIFSTEKVLSVLAGELKKDYKIRQIFVTDVDGVLDESGKTIRVISGKNFTVAKKSILGARGKDVTGGMLHKVEEALMLAKKYKISTLIVNGDKKGKLKQAILGGEAGGTFIT